MRADHSGGSRLSFNKYIYVFIDFLFYLFIYLRTEKNAHAREQGRLTMIIGRIAIVYTTQRERGKKRGKEMGVNGYHLIIPHAMGEVEVPEGEKAREQLPNQEYHVFTIDRGTRGKVYRT